MDLGLKYGRVIHVVARNPGEGTILLGGLGGLGVGQMWFIEQPLHEEYPGYAEAVLLEHGDEDSVA
jgi:hypothetical protein